MINPKPSISVNVDPTNPGQFFACCGLLELADRIWGGAEGWFDSLRFHVSVGSLEDLLAILVMDPPEEVHELASGLPVKPLLAPLRLSLDGGASTAITLDAWVTVKVEKNQAIAAPNQPWNFWSGQQTSFRIWRDLRTAVRGQLTSMSSDSLEDLFARPAMLSGRFGFDPGAAWNALDVGFSPNEQGIDVASSAAVELLAAIGVQRFRPELAEDRQSFIYATWGQPLAPCVAAAAAGCAIDVAPTKRFLGRVVSRGSYAALGRSVPIRGENHE